VNNKQNSIARIIKIKMASSKLVIRVKLSTAGHVPSKTNIIIQMQHPSLNYFSKLD
jgi:hypothetical protein